MGNVETVFTLILAPKDHAKRKAVDRELKSLGLCETTPPSKMIFRGKEVEPGIGHKLDWVEHAAAPAETIIRVAAIVGPGLGTALGTWLQNRVGRRIRLKVGDIEAQAHTINELKGLLEEARGIQQRNEPKKIHEP